MACALASLSIAVLIAGCGPSVQHQKAEEALKRLQKVDAATTVGVAYAPYRQLLVDAQEAVNDMECSEHPAPGRLEVEAAMQTYTEAGQLWERVIFHEGMIYTCGYEPLAPLIAKYQLVVSEPQNRCSFTTELKIDMGELVWPKAKRHVNEAAKQIHADQDTWSHIKAFVPGLG